MNKSLYMWVLRIIPTVIMLQTLFFKFTAHPDSVDLFSRLGVEPYGRIGTGVLELIASILIMIPRFTIFGAFLGLGLMGGAIMSHLTIIGIVTLNQGKNDGGFLFILAIITALCCFALLWLSKVEILKLINSVFPKK